MFLFYTFFTNIRALVPVPYLTHTVTAHQTGFVDIARHTVYPSLRGVLPCENVTSVTENRRAVVVFGDKQLVAVQLVGEVVVVEALVCVYQRLLMVRPLKQVEELVQRVAEFPTSQSAGGLDVDHWHQILVLRTALRAEVAHLLGLRTGRAIEMV